MRRHIFLLFFLMIFLTFNANAFAVTFLFDPNDLLDLYPSSAGTSDTNGQNKATQIDARRLHRQWATTWYETFYNPPAPQLQPHSYNNYMNWLDGLGAGEGISGFNIWMLDNPAARSWGENVVWNPSGAAPQSTADAAGFWNTSIIANPWGPGWLAQWWTDNPLYYLRPGGQNIGNFSFSGSAYWDNNQNGYDITDPLVQIGESARIWFGALNSTDNGSQEWSVHFDNIGWGNRPTLNAPFSAGLVGSNGYGSGWEGVLDVPAVPEPGTMLLLGSGLLGLAGFRRKLKKS